MPTKKRKKSQSRSLHHTVLWRQLRLVAACIVVISLAIASLAIWAKPPMLKMVSGAVVITDTTGWKRVAETSGPKNCDGSISSSAFSTCLDSVTFIPSNETYTNPDQFTVLVSIYAHSTTTFIHSFVTNDDGIHGGFGAPYDDATYETLIGKAGQIVKGEKVYPHETNGVVDSEETDLEYGILSPKYDIFVSSRPFIGQHYSYPNTAGIDYRKYIPKIDTLVQSIEFEQ